MQTNMDSTGKIAVQNFKRSVGALLALLSGWPAAVHALQTVDPRLTVAGTSIATSTQTVPAGSTFSFYGVYSDDSAVTASNTTGAESGLGLKVKYNGLHLTNVSITEEFTKCRIAVAQYPATNSPPTTPTATDQVVMGWIDTAIRPSGAVASANGSVGWPDLIDQASTGQCLNPGAINNDTAAVAPSGLKLFKFTATMASTCTSPAACTSAVTFDSEGNYSFANAGSGTGAGMPVNTFNIAGAAAPTIALAAANPYVSRKTHGVAGVFDITIDPAGSTAPNTLVTTEPRQSQSGAHQIVIAFTSPVTAAQMPTVTAVAGATSFPVTTAFSGNEMTVTIGSAAVPITNATRVTVSAAGSGSAAGVNPSVVVGFLLGDVVQSRGVNAADVGTVRGAVGVPITASNFRSDVVVSGGVNAADVGTVRGQVGSGGSAF